MRLSAARIVMRRKPKLELLREASKIAWEWVEWASTDERYSNKVCWQCGLNANTMKHDDDCFVARILRTDPERAKRMGLGWAL